MFITTSLLGDLIGLFITLVVLFILYCKWTYGYWKRRNVPYFEPEIPFGNIGDAVRGKENIGLIVKRYYDEMKARGWKHGGIFMLLSPNYYPLELEQIKNILTKDFQYFSDRNIYVNEKDDPLGASLAHITGQRWKNLRSKLTPTFTSGKMKMMFQTLVEAEASLRKQVERYCETKEPIDIKEVLACFTTDVIGSVAFGLDCKSFAGEDSPFRVYGRKLFETPPSRRWKRLFATALPNFARFVGITETPKDVAEFFMKIVQDTVDYRIKNNYTRNDFLQLLINMKNKSSEDGEKAEGTTLTMEQLAAQSLTFFGGGFETSSTTMTFVLYELAKHQDIQQKLRDEIKTVLDKHNGKITYESTQEMKYLSQVIDETLRLHPPASMTNRKCLKDYKVPGTDLVLEKGITVIIPIMGIHYDPEYYPNPEKFDPENFSDERKNSRPAYTHLPFGEGPRICIGMRFALMQAKVGLVSLINNFNFTVNKKTKEPLKLEVGNILASVEGGVWLNAQKI